MNEMRIAEYKQIESKFIERQKWVIDIEATETAEEVGHFETYTEVVPVMGMAYRDATPEEEAESERMAEEMPPIPKTAEEQIEELKAQNEMLTECLLELADIIYA